MNKHGRWEETKPFWVKHMEDALFEYYGARVMPPEEYCYALLIWAKTVIKNYDEDDTWRDTNLYESAVALQRSELAIRKSNLLWRLIYCGEKLRIEKCPIHKGKWSGYGDCQNTPPCNYGWDMTGWLPLEDEEIK